MTQEFRKFLKDRNAYENYIGNTKGESDNPYEYFDGFYWDSSKEGYDYWSDLDSEWFEYLDKSEIFKELYEKFREVNTNEN